MADISRNVANRTGIAKGKDLYDDDHDFDEMNPEIAKMFMGESIQNNQKKDEGICKFE